MEFNFPPIPRIDDDPDTVQLAKIAEGVQNSGGYGFNIYSSVTKPDDQAALPETPASVINISNTDDETITFDSNVQWIRVVETAESAEDYSSTAYWSYKSSSDTAPGTHSGRDTGWMPKADAQLLVCLNLIGNSYITVTKLDAATNKAIQGVSFKLYEKTASGDTEISTKSFVTDKNGEFFLNYIDWDEKERLAGKTYILKEQAAAQGYKKNSDNVVFTLNGNGNVTNVSGPASKGSGSHIYIYNEQKTGSVTVKKSADDDIILAQGAPVFLFKVEQIKDGEVLKTWVKELVFDKEDSTKNFKVFGGLAWGYSYKVSEITDVMRYSQQEEEAVTVIGIDNNAVTISDDKTVAFALNAGDVETENFITVTFNNDRITNGYLSDTYVKANHFAFDGPTTSPPGGGELKTQTVTITNASKNITVTLSVLKGSTLSGLNPVSGLTAAEWQGFSDGGWTYGTEDDVFYPWTPVNADITITAKPKTTGTGGTAP
jgi:hypothetical protein